MAVKPAPSATLASSSPCLSSGSSTFPVALWPPGAGAAAAPPAGGKGWGGKWSSGVELVNLDRLLLNAEFDCSDADVDMADGGPPVPVHRCILAARSDFFYDLFAARARGDGGGGRPRYMMEELVPGGRVGREAFLASLGYLYTGKLRPAPHDVVTCVDPLCLHDSCPPAIRYAIELMYAAWTFRMPELISLFQQRLLTFVDKALLEDVLPIVQVAFHLEQTQVLNKCVRRIARSDPDNISLDKELPPEVADEIKKMQHKSQPSDGDTSICDPVHEKRVRAIHRAMDVDDVELVRLLLHESEITLDGANALHYAAVYCDFRVVLGLLDLGLANLNLKNRRGYTALHLAAMRRDPAIIMCLLNKGAMVSQLAADGRCAISICRRLTRAKDYNAKTEKGQESCKDKMCISILEREMMKNLLQVERCPTLPLLADDLHMKLLFLENRVAFVRLFFPAEAKVTMQIAQVDTTPEFGYVTAASTFNKLREVDLNETPVIRNKRLRSRVDALVKTVELGRLYFPNCTQVIDKFFEKDLTDGLDAFYLRKDTPDEQKIKKMRFSKLQEEVSKAFGKDAFDRNMKRALSSCSSGSQSQPQKVGKRWRAL